jgi:tetratricopeptide (TPR) repeat protein
MLVGTDAERPLAAATLRELQEPCGLTSGVLARPRSLAWVVGGDAEPAAWRRRTSLAGEHSAYVGFSPGFQVGVVLLGTRVGDLEEEGDALVRGALRHLGAYRAFLDRWDAADAAGRRAALAILERSCERRPDDPFPFTQLAFYRMRAGDYPGAVEPFRRAYALGYASYATAYNMACCQVAVGDHDAAFAWLERSLALGFKRARLLAEDPDLDPLREDPRFARLEIRAP